MSVWIVFLFIFLGGRLSVGISVENFEKGQQLNVLKMNAKCLAYGNVCMKMKLLS